MLASVIIRTYNEGAYLAELLGALSQLRGELIKHEVVVIDSGSTDQTLAIAEQFGCRVGRISKKDFTFGRSLNQGCNLAKGDILAFISGHCVPTHEQWLTNLCKPLLDGSAAYAYGRQLGRDTTKFSEEQLFKKFYPAYSKLPQEGFFVNNANAAITREAWQKFRFNEELTGLEDMYLAKLLVETGEKIGYVANAPVWHIHDETWPQVKLRYEREAYALQRIMPEVHFSLIDFIRYFTSGMLADLTISLKERVLLRNFSEVVLFRFNHYWGTYQGSRQTRKLGMERKHNYFYAKDLEKLDYHEPEDHRTVTNEST